MEKKYDNKTIHKILYILVFILIIGFLLKGRVSGTKFNSNLWKNSDLSLEENWHLRWDMMNSLRNNYELVGKTEQEITTLLGEYPSGNEFYYYLGYSGMEFKRGYLVIIFNSKRIVTRIRVHQG